MPVSLSKEYSQALGVSLIFQVFFFFFSVLMLDGGQLFQWWAVATLAYWAGFGLVAIRRPHKPARLDLFLIRWSFPVLFLLVTPAIMMGIWKVKGVTF